MITYAPKRREMLDNPTAHRYQIQDERGYTLVSSHDLDEIKSIFYSMINDFLIIYRYYHTDTFLVYDSERNKTIGVYGVFSKNIKFDEE